MAGHAVCKGYYNTGAYWTNITVYKTCNNESNTTPDSSDDDDDEEEEGSIFEKMTLEDRLKELAEVSMCEDSTIATNIFVCRSFCILTVGTIHDSEFCAIYFIGLRWC